MLKKYLRLLSFILQSTYSAFCILDIIICLIYNYSFGTAFGSKCAHWALHLTGIIFLVPALPIGILLNILAMPPRQTETTYRKNWIIWTIISSCLYFILCFAAVCIFVVTTGGV